MQTTHLHDNLETVKVKIMENVIGTCRLSKSCTMVPADRAARVDRAKRLVSHHTRARKVLVLDLLSLFSIHFSQLTRDYRSKQLKGREGATERSRATLVRPHPRATPWGSLSVRISPDTTPRLVLEVAISLNMMCAILMI